MSYLLITYDLRTETKRPRIADEIRRIYPSHCKICDSSYVVETIDSLDQASAKLDHLFDGNDWRAVFRLVPGDCWQGWIPEDAAAWLNQRLCP